MTDSNHVHLWSVRIAAERLGVPEPTLRGWVRRGVVPSVRIGGRRLLDAADIARLIIQAKAVTTMPGSTTGES